MCKPKEMNSTIGKILEKLNQYSEIKHELTENSIIIRPKDKSGFPVKMIIRDRNKFIVAFDFWHEEFDNEEEALNCFAFGLSTECRLKLTKRGVSIIEWTLEYQESGVWKEDSTSGKFNFAFWKSKSIEYLQNNLIERK